MKTLGIDNNNDWNIFTIKQGGNAVIQDITTALQEWYGDCWFNTEAGLNWQILGDLKEDAEIYIEERVRSIVLGVQGVDAIINFEGQRQDAKYTIKLTFKFNQSILEFEKAFNIGVNAN